MGTWEFYFFNEQPITLIGKIIEALIKNMVQVVWFIAAFKLMVETEMVWWIRI